MAKQQESLSQAALQSLAEGIIVMDMGQVIQLANPAACRLLDIDENSVIGNRFLDVPIMAGLEATGQAIDLSEATRLPYGPYEHEWGIASPHGRFLWFQTRPVTDSAQQRTGTLIRISDKTPERTAREMLPAMFNEMLAPLQLIKGYADCLLGGTEGPLTEGQQKAVSIISARAEALLKFRDSVIEAFEKQAQDKAKEIQ